MPDPSQRLYRFSGHRMDVRTRELRDAAGARVPLTAKAFDVLRHLVEHRDRVVGKDELLEAVWQGRVIEENSLAKTVSALRHALGVDGADHRFIVTIPGHGYRFVADVQAGPGPDAGSVDGVAAGVAPQAIASRRWPFLWGALLALGLVAAVAWSLREPREPVMVPGQTTLAVLPFRPLSGGPPDRMLDLGLAETVIARLSQSRSLRVRSLASAERAAGRSPDPLAAARTLGAAYVVEGSTQRHGERVRVNARLLAAPAGTTVWAGTFDERIERIFTLQDGIAAAVFSALALPPRAAPARSPCEGGDAEAYRAYLTGRYLGLRPSPERLQNALAAYQRAIARDPACAPAYAGSAHIYRGLVITGDRAPREIFPLSKAAIDQALRIDPDHAGALASRAFDQYWHDWDWKGAEDSARRAVALNPSLPEAQFARAHLLVNLGRFDEGLAHARQARELDPLSPLYHAIEGGFLGAAGWDREARVRLAQALELEPEFWIALLVRGGLALDAGDHAAAIADMQRAVERSRGNSQALAMLAIAHAAAGDRAQAERVLGTLERRAATRYVPPTALASVHNALGRTDAALGQLERAVEVRDVRMAFLKVDARWNNLRDQPRFRAVAGRVGLDADAPARGRF